MDFSVAKVKLAGSKTNLSLSKYQSKPHTQYLLINE